MAKVSPAEMGYVDSRYESVQTPEDWDFVPVGSETKRGDIAFDEGQASWVFMNDKHIGRTIEPTFRPIARKRRWACAHKREPSDKFCPVCIVFNRYIEENW